MKNLFWGRFLSKVITVAFKKGLDQHSMNPVFQEMIQQKNLERVIEMEEFKKADSTWEIDSLFTYKLASTPNQTSRTSTPTTTRSPASTTSRKSKSRVSSSTLWKTPFACGFLPRITRRKEAIPIDLLYLNQNIITVLSSHGGHIEYLNGLDQKWWGFQLMLDYFSFFENQSTNVKSKEKISAN